ncbi:MAG: hypothetical protein GY941_11145 [Planctomycetes bacterium]|nr:hypothetical protein [Planctomycetota bacterium]
MNKRKNKKKIVSCCPSLVSRSQCPSIRRTRQIRRALLMLQRDVNVSQEALEKTRIKLRQKKNQGITVDCEGCIHSTAKEVA